ncbi:hypothetical protein TNCV_2305021 [Trichonephila clavipes]|nr:hypothetical protein TNCV_2305021 [Trichonephila clavipes]
MTILSRMGEQGIRPTFHSRGRPSLATTRDISPGDQYHPQKRGDTPPHTRVGRRHKHQTIDKGPLGSGTARAGSARPHQTSAPHRFDWHTCLHPSFSFGLLATVSG